MGLRYQTERCLYCAWPERPTNLQSKYNLATDGRFAGTEYWFCKDECYEQAFSELISNKAYLPGKTVYESPEYIQYGKEVKERWGFVCDQVKLFESGWEPDNLFTRMDRKCFEAEKQNYFDSWYKDALPEIKKNGWQIGFDFSTEQQKAIAAARDKIDRRILSEWKAEQRKRADEALAYVQKELERQKREQERLEKERQREVERQMREQERLEEKRAKEEEKQRKEQERIEQLKERPIPEEDRFSGTWILAPPKRGKTNLLRHMLLKDIKKIPDCSIVVMDGKGELIRPLIDSAYHHERTILVDPHAPIAINPLDVPKENVGEAVERLKYVFDALLESPLTPKQEALFRSVLRALITGFDSPTLETFRDIMTNGVKNFAAEIDKLPQDLRDFFTTEFKDYDATRSELKWRLRLIFENELIKRMMVAPRTRLHIGKELDEGKIIIINNSRKLLGTFGSEFIGRFWLNQIWQAAVERTDRGMEEKKSVYVYMDEAQMIIRRDELVADTIDTCRSERIALIIAHQRLSQIERPYTLSALANCAIRICSSDDDAKTMADKLHTEPEHISGCKTGQFAVYVRGMTSHAFTMNVPWTEYGVSTTPHTDILKYYYRRMREFYGPEPIEKKVTLAVSPEVTKSLQQIKDPSKPSQWGKKDHPSKGPAQRKDQEDAADPHTGEHTEPSSKWGS